METEYSLLKTIDEEINGAVSTGDKYAGKDLLVYPNPFGDWLHVQTEAQSSANLILSDGQGRTVLRKNFNGKGVISLNSGNLPKGFYCLTIVNDKEVVSEKLIKQ